jgi:hypothetical protein
VDDCLGFRARERRLVERHDCFDRHGQRAGPKAASKAFRTARAGVSSASSLSSSVRMVASGSRPLVVPTAAGAGADRGPGAFFLVASFGFFCLAGVAPPFSSASRFGQTFLLWPGVRQYPHVVAWVG